MQCPNCNTDSSFTQENNSIGLVVGMICDRCDRKMTYYDYKQMESSLSQDTTDSDNQSVTITDIKMPFLSMVEFMVMWALASIPAFIILFIIGFFVAGILGIGAVSIFK